MFIYSVILSTIILSMLGLTVINNNRFYNGSANQEVLGQVLASNLKTEFACKENLDLAYDAGLAFDATAAASEAGQTVKVKVPQWPGLSTNADNVLALGKSVESMDLMVENLNISNARLINTSGNIRTYHGVLSIQTKHSGFLGSTYARKPASYLSISVDTASGNRVVACSEDNSDSAICSRYGGVFNASGNPKCSMPAPNVKCADGEVLVGIDSNQQAICQTYTQQCPAGQYMTGYEAKGAVKCVAIPSTGGPSGPGGGTGTTTTTLPKGPKSSTGVWAAKAHAVNDVTCPKFLMPDLVNSDPNGIAGRACYSIGFQCREIICGYSGGMVLTRDTGARPCLGTSKGETPLIDRTLECIEGTPSVGGNKAVPDKKLRTSAKPTEKKSPDLTPPTCNSHFVCSMPGEKCKIENLDPATGVPTGTADIFTCEEHNDEYGIMKYSRTVNVTFPATCDPVDLPYTDSRFLEYVSYTGFSSGAMTWCEFFAAQAQLSVTGSCNMYEEGYSCSNKGYDLCVVRQGTTNQFKVYSCQ